MRVAIFLITLLFLTSCAEKTGNYSSEGKNQTEESKAQNTNDSETEYTETSEITCPKCGYSKTETLPTEVCQIKYTCTKCKAELSPKDGDCCVYCSYGTHKCPSKQ